MYKLRLSYGGGLGDVIEATGTGEIELLDDLVGDEKAEIYLVSHNPACRQVFEYHPNSKNFDIKQVDWYDPTHEQKMRKFYNIEPAPPKYSTTDLHPHYFCPKEDITTIEKIVGPYVVIAAGAGERFRAIPDDLLNVIVDYFNQLNIQCVFVGLNYARGHAFRNNQNLRYEPQLELPNVISMVDRLTVPGTFELIKRSKGVICCHSSMYMYLRQIRKPFCLLYPKHVHIYSVVHRDHYAVGLEENHVYHSIFEDFDINYFSDWVDKIMAVRETILTTYPIDECRKFIVPRQARLTPGYDVRFLCHLTEQIKGDVLDIGCSVGLTTRDLAKNFCDKTVYAFDDTDSNYRTPEVQRRFINGHTDCREARFMKNVKFIGDDQHKIAALSNIDLVFVDGAASFEGVKQNTERALALQPKYIVWHDYFESHDMPWLGTYDYLNTTDFKLHKLEESSIVYTQLRN